MTTLDGVTKKKPAEESAEQQAAVGHRVAHQHRHAQQRSAGCRGPGADQGHVAVVGLLELGQVGPRGRRADDVGGLTLSVLDGGDGVDHRVQVVGHHAAGGQRQVEQPSRWCGVGTGGRSPTADNPTSPARNKARRRGVLNRYSRLVAGMLAFIQ